MTNRTGLCDAHHLEGIHGGWLTVEGRAGERVIWRLGLRNREADEIWSVSGDDDARQVRPSGGTG